MKKIYIVLFTLFISATSFSQEIISGNKTGPQFGLGQNEIAIDTNTINETKIIKVSFINDGTEPLVFLNKNSSCSCLATEMPEDVKPGESGELNIHFTPTRTGKFNELIYVQTNAQTRPLLLKFKAEVGE